MQGIEVRAAESERQLAGSLAGVGAVPREWLGLGWTDLVPFTLVVVPDAQAMQRWSRGSLPAWSAGAALPGRRTVVIRADAGNPFQTFRHELAHLAFHGRISQRVPLWFSEGYAVLASGEFGRLASLQLNLSVALGRIGSLQAVDMALRSSPGEAAAGYALAGAAVSEVARRNPANSLQPILARLEAGEPFEEALLATTGLGLPDFDEQWGLAVRRRYSLGLWIVAGGGWVLLAAVLSVGLSLRRKRDVPRRAALDTGWELPPDEDGAAAEGEGGPPPPFHDEIPSPRMTVR